MDSLESMDKLREVKTEKSDRANCIDPMVSFLRLFQYSSWLDKFLIFIGGTAAVLSGFMYSVMAIVMGNLVGIFVDIFLPSNITNGTATTTNSTMKVDDELMADIHQCVLHFLAIGILFFCLIAIMVSTLNIAAANQALKIKCLFMKSILRQNIGWFDTNQKGDFTTQITDNMTHVQETIGENFGLYVSFLLEAMTSAISALYFGWKLTLAAACIFAANMILIQFASKMQATAISKENDSYSAAGSVAEEALSSIKTVAAFGNESKEIERYSSYASITKSYGIKRSLITSIVTGFVWCNAYFCCAFIVWYGLVLIVEGRTTGNYEYTAKNVTIIFLDILICTSDVGQVLMHFEAFNVGRGAAAKLFKIIERMSMIDSSSEKGLTPSCIIGDITLDGVYFNYPARPEIPILRGLSLNAKSGETVALVGSSGCGKSTVVQLIQRFYDVDEGYIKFDQNDIKDLNIGWVRNNIGVVDQEPVLFSDTIAENIRYGKSDASQLEIEKAASLANVHDFIKSLPKGYDTSVGSGGSHLSGGQKQRIAIARAIVNDPRVLLLDEATSSLDRESESIVQDALDKARKNRTTIVVAHRLSSVRKADRIYAMENGVIKEIGTHEELMAKQGIYYQLFINQETTDNLFTKCEGIANSTNDHLANDGFPLRLVADNDSRQVVLNVEDSDHLKEDSAGGITQPMMQKFIQYSLPDLPYMLIGSVSALLAGLSPLFYGFLIGDILQLFSADTMEIESNISFYSWLFTGFAIATGISNFMQIFMFSVAGERLTFRLRKMAFSTMMYQDMSWFDLPQNSVGALCSRLASDTSDIQAVGGIRISIILQALSAFISLTVIGFYYNWQIGFIIVSSMVIIFLAAYCENIMICKNTQNNKSATDEALKVGVEAIMNIRTVMSLHQEESFFTKFKAPLLLILKKSRKISAIRSIVLGLSRSTYVFIYAAVSYCGSIYILRNVLHYGDMVKVLEGVLMGMYIICSAVVFVPNYQRGKTAAARLFKLLNENKPAAELPNANNLENWLGKTEFENVRFSYPSRPNVEVLKQFSLEIGYGKTVGLVGPSGCGKTTCIELIEKFYEASGGELTFDSENANSLKVSTLRSRVALVSQEPSLFSYSIADNIAYGDNSRSILMEEIVEAAKCSNIHDFISSLPQGYATVLGKKGTQLSGGQKQRIALARALIRKPKLLLLDEATSSLDAENEKVVQAALEKACVDRTCIVIAHRLTTVQNADLIAVVQDGQIVEKGTHHELLKLYGHYYNMYNSQNTKRMYT